MRTARLATALLALELGCASQSRLLREERVAEIQPGATHREEIRSWFGSPDAVRVESSGRAHWGYQRANRGFARGPVGRWLLAPVSTFFEEYVFFPPSPTRGAELLRDRLDVAFDADGLVTRFEFEREGPAE